MTTDCQSLSNSKVSQIQLSERPVVENKTAEKLSRDTLQAGGAVLLLPGLLATITAQAADQAADQTTGNRLPCLSRLLSRAEALRLPGAGKHAHSLESLVSESLSSEGLSSEGQASDVKNAGVSLLTYQQDFGDREPASHKAAVNVLRADPVYQQLDMHSATLGDPSMLDLDRAESQSLLDTLNQHFADDGLWFENQSPARWYVHFDELPDVETTPVSVAVGCDVALCRPQGPDARSWRRQLAEVEMLLYEHPVNLHRQSAGKLPVNSLWLWGEGQQRVDSSAAGSTALPAGLPDSISIATDHFYAQCVASHLQLPVSSLEQLESPSFDCSSKSLLVVAESLALSAVTSDVEKHLQNLQMLEQIVCRTLWPNLGKRGWPMILIWVGDQRFYHVEAGAKRKFWRRSKPLITFVDNAELYDNN